MLADASASATIASQAVERVSCQAVHDTATACTKKLSQEMVEPIEYQRKFRSPNASAMRQAESQGGLRSSPPLGGVPLAFSLAGRRGAIMPRRAPPKSAPLRP